LEDVTRFYSLCFATNPGRVAKRNEAAAACGIETSDAQGDNNDEALNLIIKRYERGALTSYLDNLDIGSQVMVSGPLGPGLFLTSDTKGTAVAIAGGTGLLPFLDLVDLLFWKQAYALHDVTPPVNTDPCDGLVLNLYAGFGSTEDVFGRDILLQAAKVNESAETPNFKYHFHCNGAPDSDGKLSEEVIEALVPQDATMVWICGPSGFNLFALDLLTKKGIPRDRIYVL
jgi:NAD(P)H-flavin reductase